MFPLALNILKFSILPFVKMVHLNLSSHTIQNRNSPFLHELLMHPDKDSVTSINLSGRYLITSMIYQLFHIILPSFPHVQEINLSNTSIFDLDLELILETGLFFQYMTTLDLRHNLLECLSFQKFHLHFHMCYLQILLLDNNEIECNGATQLASNFNRLPFLKHLSLSNNFIRDLGFLSIAKNFHELQNFCNLNILGNICQNDCFLYFLQSIPKTIEVLNLGSICYFHLRIGTIPNLEIYTSYISDTLQELTYLKELFWNMYIDQHIVNSWYFLQNLTHLICNRSFIHHGILQHFPYLPNLTHIHISSIYSNSIIHILRNLPPGLTTIRFHHIFFSDKAIKYLYTLISNQHSLQVLEISESNLEDFHTYYICHYIPLKSNINSLIFSRNYIGQKKKFSKFVNLLPIFPNLKIFSLYGNPITNPHLEKLIYIFLRAPFHEQISISISTGNFSTFFSSVSLQPYILLFSKFLYTFHRQTYITPSLYRFVNHVRKFRPIQHHIDVVPYGTYGVSNYNDALQQIKSNLQDSLGYKMFNKHLSHTLLPNTSCSILYSEDIQSVILSFYDKN